jgi:transcriptional regulator with XRE-family HTH domain
MNQVEIAKKAGISQGFVSLILTGQRRPDWDLAKLLAEITKTDVALWMEGDESEKREALKAA